MEKQGVVQNGVTCCDCCCKVAVEVQTEKKTARCCEHLEQKDVKTAEVAGPSLKAFVESLE